MKRRVAHSSLATGLALVFLVGAGFPARGSSGPETRDDHPPQPGPTVRVPSPSPASHSGTAAGANSAGSKSAFDSGSSSAGGNLFGVRSGVAADPKKEADYRIRKVIRRLG